jgi:hypothetical protein
MPPHTPASRQAQASSANFMGGTTKQLDMLTKGRARHLSSPPAISCSMASASSTCSGITKLVPTCLAVPETEA